MSTDTSVISNQLENTIDTTPPLEFALEEFITEKNLNIKDDASIITLFELENTEGCKKVIARDENLTQDIIEIVPLTPISGSGLYAKVRTSLPGHDVFRTEIWDNGTIAYNDVIILEFYSKNNEEYAVSNKIPPLDGWDCIFPGYIKVYALNTDLILVEIDGGHEASPIHMYFDGKNWHNAEDFILTNLGLTEDVYLAPLRVKSDGEYISFTEERYCCDMTNWLHPTKKTELVFDIKLSLLHAVLHNR